MAEFDNERFQLLMEEIQADLGRAIQVVKKELGSYAARGLETGELSDLIQEVFVHIRLARHEAKQEPTH